MNAAREVDGYEGIAAGDEVRAVREHHDGLDAPYPDASAEAAPLARTAAAIETTVASPVATWQQRRLPRAPRAIRLPDSDQVPLYCSSQR
jgi:hypothetical protein